MKFFQTKRNENQPPSSLVFLLHGWGSNGRDLLSIADLWRPHLPDTLFICPEGPEVCDQNPMGYQWFSLGDWSPEFFIKGAEKARAPLNEFIQSKKKEYNMPADKIVMMGFSQGMMMALSCGLRQKDALGGILGYSGALIDNMEDIVDTYPKPPISIIHGLADDVVPVARHDEALAKLQSHNYQVDSLKVPGLAHGIEQQGLLAGLDFLKNTIAN